MTYKSRLSHLASRFSLLKSGFTLIELLVVIAIIGILIAVGSISYTRAVRLSRDSRRKTDLEQIRQALETYRSENNQYPSDASLETSLVPSFITTMPKDPKDGTAGYDYTYDQTSLTTYTLCAELENSDVTTYCVANP